MNFHEQYRKWLDDCLEEYNGMFYPRDYHQDNLPEDYDGDPGNFVEFSEDGSAYPHGMCGTNYIKGCVTPWEKSEHYCHWSIK